MRPVRKSSLATEAEKELRTAILSGQFGSTLPGLRVLAKVLGVSPPTVAEALKGLIAEGLIKSDGARRRMKLAGAADPASAREGAGAKLLWFVTSSTFEHALPGSMALMSHMQQMLVGSPWQMKHRTLSYGHSENRSGQWDRLLEAERPDEMVVWTGRPAFGEWALKRGLRTLFIGGAKESLPLPMLSVKSADMVERALSELIKLGHRSFFLPMCNRPPGTVKNIRTAVSKRLRSLGQVAKDMVQVSAYEGREVIEAMVAQALVERAPTGWIFFDWREFLAASCVFRDQGISLPQDGSAILLSWDPAMDWYRPLPAHFRQPLERMAKAATDWIVEAGEGSETRRFQAEWVPGAALGPAPATKFPE